MSSDLFPQPFWAAQNAPVSGAEAAAGGEFSPGLASEGRCAAPDRAATPVDRGHDERQDEASESEDEHRHEGESEESDQAPTTEPDEEQAGKRPWYHRPHLVLFLAVGAVVLVVVGMLYWLHARRFEWTDDAFIEGHIVQIAPKVSGYVSKLLVTDNQLVEAGDLLLVIEPRDFNLSLAQAKTSEASSVAEVEQAEAQIKVAVAQVQAARDNQRAAEATALYNERVAERDRKLAPTAVSAEDLDNSISRARSSAAQANAAAAQTAAALSQVLLAERQKSTAATRLESARIERRMAETNLGYTELRAPITGHVTHRTVEMGDYIVPGRALFALVDPNVWVTANYKETQLSNMRIGQHADVRVDAFPGRILSAHVDSFQRGTGARFSLLPAENATGNYVKIVQRVPVKLVFDEPLPADMMLGPGMSVEPTVTVR